LEDRDKGRHKDSDLEAKLLTGLAKISLAFRAEEQKQSFEVRLSPTQAKALLLVEDGIQSPSEISKRIGVSRASLSDSLTALQDKGLLKKRRSPEDSRATILELTAKGRRRSDGLADWPTALQESLDDLNTEEKQMLLRVLSKIIANLQDQGSVSVPRMCANCRFFRPNTHAGSKKPHHCDYINSAFSDGELRLDCPEHEAAEVRPKF